MFINLKSTDHVKNHLAIFFLWILKYKSTGILFSIVLYLLVKVSIIKFFFLTYLLQFTDYNFEM